MRNKTDGQRPQVCIRLTPAEYAKIKETADSLGLSVSKYCEKQSLAGRIIQADLSGATELLSTFTESKHLLRQILFVIARRGNYFPADLENIQRCIDQLTDIASETSKLMIKLIKNIRNDGRPKHG